jgi:NAD(P)-dependent dehydrogenase (short-subunit alcohol dehydrogenase family)
VDIAGKVVVVTGGASGIGRAMARRFAEAGAAGVTVADIDGAGAALVAGEIDGLGIAVDVSFEEELAKVIATTEERFGPIDLFCSNAGIAMLGGADVPDEAWQQIIDINVMAHVYAARLLLPRWIERGTGYFLNTASAAGLLTQLGSAPYSVTKHAAVAFAEWVAITHGDQGIKISVLCPQGVRTAMTAPMGDEESGAVIAVDGMLEPEEVADAVIDGLADERFLILPHPEVGEYFLRKATDYDRWLGGMRRLQGRLMGIE